MKSGRNDGALSGRLVAIVIVTAISAGSFTLGFYVGKTESPQKDLSMEVHAPVPPVEARQTQNPQSPEAGLFSESAMPASPDKPIAPETWTPPKTIDEPPAPPAPPPIKPVAVAQAREAAAVPPPETARVQKKRIPPPKKLAYSVQAGLFSESARADSLTRRLRQKGYDAFVQTAGAGGGDEIYKVIAGRFWSREDASKTVSRLRETEGLSAFVTGPG